MFFLFGAGGSISITASSSSASSADMLNGAPSAECVKYVLGLCPTGFIQMSEFAVITLFQIQTLLHLVIQVMLM